MIQPGKYFTLPEFEKDGPIPAECLPVLTELCQTVLDVVREQFGPLTITSGYRPPTANAEAHGQSNSEHIYTSRKCAADFLVDDGTDFIVGTERKAFDWMRNNPDLPYHQLILEHGADGSSVVHVSINLDMPGVRSVLEGATHNASPYVKIDHVAYVAPTNNAEDVETAANGD
jgi:hypothetical protein